MERAVEREGGKGCSPFLCTVPVALEPPYDFFDARCVLRALEPVREVPLASTRQVSFVTLNVYAGEEDILSISWMETVLRSIAVLPGPFGFELFGRAGTVWLRFAGWILLALEFALAADLVRTAIAPSWDDIGKLGAIAGIRTFLGYFLGRDLETAEEGNPREIAVPEAEP